MKNFTKEYGQWALVTGASSGIGRAISVQLAKQGVNLVTVARNENNLLSLQKELEKNGIEVLSIAADLSVPGSSETINKKTAHLDIGLLVANAGIENNGEFMNTPIENEKKLLALNINSPMELSHAFANRFAQKGKGGILFLSSLFGYQGVPRVANYSASKAYILSLGEALNVELKPLGIDVTVLSPGLTKTAMPENMDVDFNKMPITQHQPEVVAKVGLNALGKKATVVPGFINKFYAWENRLIPRSWPVKLFGFLIKRATEVKSDTSEIVIR